MQGNAPQPPLPDTGERAARIPKDAALGRARVWARFLRMKFGRAILLPQLSPSEAYDLRHSVEDEGALTSGYMLMCALSAGIATLGLLQSSTAVVIGAMLISPLMSPIAALGFGFASFDGARIKKAARVVAFGAAIGILTAVLLTWISPIRNATPEILARTEPTLLDLAVALFSGIAGGYATVIRKGGTAIGVAIATALMPPLAVVGYGIGVLQVQFALGALLLFLTNLAAITLSFAIIARLSGAAKPLYSVELKPRFVIIFVSAFLVLAVPLSMTLSRLSKEATLRTAARAAIIEASGGGKADIAQIEVSWPLFGEPSVDALVVAPTYTPNAEETARASISAAMDAPVRVNLQQLQAADLQSQTRAMIDAAMERTAAGIAADVPPYERIRASIGLPTRALWSNRAERLVFVEPFPAPDWTLADYAALEREAIVPQQKWTVRIIPPPQPTLRVIIRPGPQSDEAAIMPALAAWALKRWGLGSVRIAAPPGDATAVFVERLRQAGITAVVDGEGMVPTEDGEAIIATVRVYAESPTRRAAELRESQ
jgi:uncharacterized hydrophobic protein (TIGR00271 family)